MSTLLGPVWWMPGLGCWSPSTNWPLGRALVRGEGIAVLDRFWPPAVDARVGKDGTEYVIAAIRWRLREDADERATSRSAERAQAFNHKPVLQRMAIVVAGPAANPPLAVGLLWAMLVVGGPDYALSWAGPTACRCGRTVAGDRILSVDGRATLTGSEAELALAVAALDRQPVALGGRQ